MSSNSIPPDLVRKCVSKMYGVLTCDVDLKKFFDSNLPSFICKVEEGDETHEIEWTSIYGEFEALMESKLEDIAIEMGISNVADFFEALKSSLASADGGGIERSGFGDGARLVTKEQRMMDMLVSSYDYEKFVVLMKIKTR